MNAIRKQVSNVTVNDVVLTVCGGAMRKYLAAHNELPSEPLVAMCPISTRGAEGKNALGNQVSGMLVPFGSHIEGRCHQQTGVGEQHLVVFEKRDVIHANMNRNIVVSKADSLG